MVPTLLAIGLLAGCGSDGSSAVTSTISPESTSSVPSSEPAPETVATEPAVLTYTIVSGDTLSGIAERAGVALDELVAANAWPDGSDHLILQGDVINLPAGASIPTASGTTTPIRSDVGAAASGGYGPATVDLALSNDRTDQVTTPLADGVYYAQDTNSDGTTVTFTLGQWFACDGNGVPDEPTVDCASGFGTLDEPSASVDLAPTAVVTVATGDLDDPTRADVSAAEFARLVSGAAPAADAPAGYTFSDFATFVEVSGGSVVAVEQFYTS